MNKSELRRGIR